MIKISVETTRRMNPIALKCVYIAREMCSCRWCSSKRGEGGCWNRQAAKSLGYQLHRHPILALPPQLIPRDGRESARAYSVYKSLGRLIVHFQFRLSKENERETKTDICIRRVKRDRQRKADGVCFCTRIYERCRVLSTRLVGHQSPYRVYIYI